MEEDRLAESVLPELVWKLILDNLTMRDDIVSFGQTCKLFRRLCNSNPRREIVLFDKVLPHLVNYLIPKSNRDHLWKCRLVCKSWMNGVDKMYDDFFLNSSVYRTRYDASKLVNHSVNCNYTFANHDSVSYNIDYEQFLTEMRHHPTNPFIGHATHLSLRYPVSRRSPSFESFEEFLQVFGKHIWTLELGCEQLYLRGRCSEVGNMLPLVLKLVFGLPNLKKLDLTSDLAQFDQKLIDLYKELEPPSTLQMADLTSISSPISQAIFDQVKSQLKVLFVRELETTSQFAWDNLKQLHLLMDGVPFRPNTDLNLLRNLNLPKLELLAFGVNAWCNWFQEHKTSAFKSILEGLNELLISSPNLQTIRFYFVSLWRKKIYSPNDLDSNLQCPKNIKTFEIEEGPQDSGISGADFSFLKHFLNVENIHIIPTKYSCPGKEILERFCEMERDSVQICKFMFSGEMYKSNIWEFLPNFKTFKYLNRTYSRSCYERLRRKENGVNEK